jgi:branched-chain amino acid transport system substrate-binding protein
MKKESEMLYARSCVAACILLSGAILGGLRTVAADEQPIRIGVPLPQTGPFGNLYEQEKNAVDYAVTQINSKGGIMGRKIEVRFSDTEGKPDVARKQIEKLALDGYNLLVGTVSSSEGLAVAPNLKRWDAVLVSPFSKSSKLIGDSCQARFFRTAPSDPMVIAGVKEWLKSRQEKKWVTLGLDYAFGHDATAGFVSAAKELDKEVTTTLFAPVGTNDFAPYIQQIKDAKPDGLFVIESGRDAINFVQQAKQFGLLGTLTTGGITYNADSTRAVMGKDLVGTYGNIEFSSAIDTQQTRDFVEGWKKMFSGKEPSDQSGQMFLAFSIMLEAIEQAKSDEPEKVAKALHGGVFDTLFGKVTMRAEDHQLMIPVLMGQVKDDGQGGTELVPDLIVPAERALPNPDPACKIVID